MLDMLFKRRLKARIINAMFVLNSVQPNVNAQHCIHTPFLGKNKQHAVGSKYRLIVYYYLHWVRIQYITNIWLTYLQFARPIPRVYMNIFNDAARPHRATWLSPFFVVIEFSKAMWQIDNDFKNRLPGVDTSTSFREAKKKVNLSELFVWWISLVTPLTEDWRLCATFDSSGTLPPPYGSQQVHSLDSSSPQTLRGMTATHVLLCSRCQQCKPPCEITTPMSRKERRKKKKKTALIWKKCCQQVVESKKFSLCQLVREHAWNSNS